MIGTVRREVLPVTTLTKLVTKKMARRIESLAVGTGNHSKR